MTPSSSSHTSALIPECISNANSILQLLTIPASSKHPRIQAPAPVIVSTSGKQRQKDLYQEHQWTQCHAIQQAAGTLTKGHVQHKVVQASTILASSSIVPCNQWAGWRLTRVRVVSNHEVFEHSGIQFIEWSGRYVWHCFLLLSTNGSSSWPL